MSYRDGARLPLIENALVWIPALMILGYIPVLIYLDLKYREVDHNYWWWMVGACSPCVALLYLSGAYPAVLLMLSLASVGIYFVAMKMGLFEGADFMFLMFISLFFVQNPLSGLILMPVSFGIFLIACTIACGLFVRFVPDRKVREMFPMMIPISAAFIITLVLA